MNEDLAQGAAPAPTPVAPAPAPAPVKKNNTATIVLAVFLVLAVAASAVFAFLYFSGNNKNSNTSGNNNGGITAPTALIENEYDIDDYVTLTDVELEITDGQKEAADKTKPDVVTKIKFNNLKSTVTADFLEKQDKLISDEYASGYIVERSNKAGAAIYDGVLSVYTAFDILGTYGGSAEFMSLNVDLETGKEITAKKFVERFDVDVEALYTAALEDLIDNLTLSKNLFQGFSMNTMGYIDEDPVTIDEFLENIPEYVETLMNKGFDAVSLYIDEDGDVHMIYKAWTLLEQLGMGTHMGAGLNTNARDVKL